jgi:hypothetical protein
MFCKNSIKILRNSLQEKAIASVGSHPFSQAFCPQFFTPYALNFPWIEGNHGPGDIGANGAPKQKRY